MTPWLLVVLLAPAEDAGALARLVENPPAALASMHRGGGTCLRYGTQAPTEAQARAAAESLVRAGLRIEGLRALAGVRPAWVEELEAAHHAAGLVTEVAAYAAEHRLTAEPVALSPAVESILASTRDASSKLARTRLGPEVHDRVHGAWRDHAAVLANPAGEMRVMELVFEVLPAIVLDDAAQRTEAWVQAHGTYPADMAALEAAGLADAYRLGEDRRLVWRLGPRGGEVVDFAADRAPGGEGERADRVREVVVLGAVRPAPPAGPASAAMVVIRGGKATLGCTADCSDTHAPRQTVRVAPFRIDRTEVTAGAYAACVNAGACAIPTCAWPSEPSQPVQCVNWFQAHTYCAWAGRRLPTHHEWMRAAAGPKGRRFPGDVTPEGVADLGGGVAEWVADEFPNPPAGRLHRSERGESRVTKDAPSSAAAPFHDHAHMDAVNPENPMTFMGFRCAADTERLSGRRP